MIGSATIDSLCENMQHNSLYNKPELKFIKDLDIITKEIINEYYVQFNREYLKFTELYPNTFVNDICHNQIISSIKLDIYEILVSCGNDLTWDTNYSIKEKDFKWFQSTEGKNYFFENLQKFAQELYMIDLNAYINNYHLLLPVYVVLIELYDLAVIPYS